MSRVPAKHARDRDQAAPDFQGFLNDLQDWELSRNHKDSNKLMKSSSSAAASDKGKSKVGMGGSENRKTARRFSAVDLSSEKAGHYDYLKKFDAISSLSRGFTGEEELPDASSEKEQGNEYFKQKKFNEAIDCYSRSIALSPTAVAYANRAMAYLKVKRYHEAEEDCTEALNLDDRYIKAYSRRATARKELGKLKESADDAEFALRLEPQNQEVKKQLAEAKSLYEKEILNRASSVLKKPARKESEVEKPYIEMNEKVQEVSTISNYNQKAGISLTPENSMRNHKSGKLELKSSVQELASRAASRAMAEAAKNITPPTSAYQFEASWKGLSGDCALQAHLLKAISPSTLPQLFKNALTAPTLIEIIKCIATIFIEETDFAVKYLENLTKVSRFDMIMLCVSSQDRADLFKIWDDVFSNQTISIEYAEVLDRLRPRYCPTQ